MKKNFVSRWLDSLSIFLIYDHHFFGNRMIFGVKLGLQARRWKVLFLRDFTIHPRALSTPIKPAGFRPIRSNSSSVKRPQKNTVFLESFKIHSRNRKFWIEMLKGIVSLYILITARWNNVLHNIFSIIPLLFSNFSPNSDVLRSRKFV